MKVVINKCFGGFGVSRAVILRMRELGSEAAKHETMTGERWPDSGSVEKDDRDTFYLSDLPRHDATLVRVVEELGEDVSSAPLARLRVVEIPDGVHYEIDEYDGQERISETHRSWG